MAATVTSLEFGAFGNQKANRATVTMSSSYPTGGEVVTPEQFGLKKINDVFITPYNSATVNVIWDQANLKFKVISDGGTPAEVANASNQSAVNVRVLVLGI